MPDSLNKHVSQKSITLDPTLEDSVAVDPFEEAREEAITTAAVGWTETRVEFIREHPFFGGNDAFRAGVEAAASLPRPHRIGVFDFDSLTECLKSEFERALPGETYRDPQDAIQRLAGTVMNYRATLVEVREKLHRANYTPPLDEHDPLNDAKKSAIADIDAHLTGVL